MIYVTKRHINQIVSLTHETFRVTLMRVITNYYVLCLHLTPKNFYRWTWNFDKKSLLEWLENGKDFTRLLLM